MNRDEMIARVDDEPDRWDIIVIGGGATGLGVAVDAASRGYRTLLLEKSDFAKGTSSRSTKLAHGGVRYLEQGNLALVLDALRERGHLQRNAPHLVHARPFVVPHYHWWEAPYYGTGLKLYDLLAWRRSFGRSRHLSRGKTLDRLPTLADKGLWGGTLYYDGQFDDARLAISLAQTAVDQKAVLLNYMEVTDLIKEQNRLRGVVARDHEGKRDYRITGRVVINATGVFTDEIRQMDNPDAGPIIRPSQGIHLVLDRSFLPGRSALLIPRTTDERVMFAIPWNDVVLVGTTDTPVDRPSMEPVPLDHEVDFILEHAARYLNKRPAREDVLSIFAGLRPLVGTGENPADTASISRDHTLQTSSSGLITIAGGKWTTYRRMAADAVDRAVSAADLPDSPCMTQELRLHGYHRDAEKFGRLASYGADAPALRKLIDEDPRYGERLHPEYEPTAGEVIWAVRHEMARTVEDFLARRTRMLVIDARASIAAAPKVAALMAEELDRGQEWQEKQVQAYTQLANGYLPTNISQPEPETSS